MLMKTPPVLLLLLLLLTGATACDDDPSRSADEGALNVPPPATDGEGEGEPAPIGEGEGEPAPIGEGEGEPAPIGEGEGEPAPIGEGEGEPAPLGEGEGEPAPIGEGEGEGEVEPPADDPCPAMHRDRCIESEACVLETLGDEEGYRCRAAVNDCERAPTGDICEAKPGCEWFGGFCYCGDGDECFCGGGPPPICRERLQGCEVRLRVRHTGGLCQDGACFDDTSIEDRDYIVFDDQTPATPLYAQLPADLLAPIDAAIADTLPLELAEGYGDCCNAHFDGSDAYVTLYVDGVARPEVRVSDLQAAPEPLARLVSRLSTAGRSLRERNAVGPQCVPE